MAVSSSVSSLLHAPTGILSDRSPTPCCSIRSSFPPSSSPTALLPVRRRRRLTSTLPERWNLVVRSAVGEVSFSEAKSGEEKSQRIESLKLNLLSAVSGLNRGLVANVDDLERAETAAKELESAGGSVDLSTDLDRLQGKWKLLYSSAFSSRSLGGSRPGLPTGRLIPVTLGQVFQRIDVLSKDFDNIAEVEIGAPWPFPPVEVTATLAHKFELIGTAKIKIIFQKTTLKTSGNLSQLPPFDIPRLPDTFRPPSNPGTGDFEVTYLDDSMRITRGDRGELRVFVIA
ncbi:PREDICTED: probable plastid-lipid-associated protein 6, chloroplastic [Tarenaya hassleriana]|uniref:probable plastid-lipid-associated protein 6, chloroplastic n=1 Tax=Tarenaya hassleriana TaxID=28532 RepID=UPI00053CA446|nr:PREDICTED: probable plastid-lipid-associated protein 6, chloroplastic [Tarenaya hassleriana]